MCPTRLSLHRPDIQKRKTGKGRTTVVIKTQEEEAICIVLLRAGVRKGNTSSPFPQPWLLCIVILQHFFPVEALFQHAKEANSKAPSPSHSHRLLANLRKMSRFYLSDSGPWEPGLTHRSQPLKVGASQLPDPESPPGDTHIRTRARAHIHSFP